MRKRTISILSVACALLVAGCGSQNDKTVDPGPESEAETDLEEDNYELKDLKQLFPGIGRESDSSVFNIFCTDREVYDLFCAVTDDYRQISMEYHISDTQTLFTGEMNGHRVRWKIFEDELQYEDIIDDMLFNTEIDEDRRPDLFLIDSSLLDKYCDKNANVVLALEELGIGDKELEHQFASLRQAACDSDGNQKASTWQVPAGMFVYRKSIAEEVFGTSDPAKISAYLGDTDRLQEAAWKCKKAGYYFTSGVEDSYEFCRSEIAKPWVTEENGELTVHLSTGLTDWVRKVKRDLDSGCLAGNRSGSSEWVLDHGDDSNVFGFFVSQSELDPGFFDSEDWDAAGVGGWMRGGQWIAATAYTDDRELAAYVIRRLTVYEETLDEIALMTGKVTNHRELAEKLAGSRAGTGIRWADIVVDSANSVNMEHYTLYDESFNREFRRAALECFYEDVGWEDAVISFFMNSMNAYPELIF